MIYLVAYTLYIKICESWNSIKPIVEYAENEGQCLLSLVF